MHDDGQVDANIQLTRVREGPDQGSEELRPAEFPPFVRVIRNLHLDLDWKLDTEVVRETPTDVAVVLEIPLLPGESITTEGVRVEGGRALVTLAPGESRRSWRSVLEIQPELTLTAPESLAWAESWRLDVGSIWHVEVAGIPSIHQAGTEGDRVREWRPWPGETVVLSVTRPVGVEGPTLTIDSSRLQVEPGLRATEARLELSIRSSRGGQHRIRLPAEAVLGEITIDGVVQPMRQEEGEIALPIRPGRQEVVVQWREPRGIGDHFVYRAPVVDLGMPSVNHQVEITPSAGRWILLAGGPRLGPSVLIWPLLGVMAVLAYALGRLKQTPLRSGHWFLLFVGLTQAPIVAAAIPVVWLHAAPLARSLGYGALEGDLQSAPDRPRRVDPVGARGALLLDPAGAARDARDADRRKRIGLPCAALVPGSDRGDPAELLGALGPAARLSPRDAGLGPLDRAGAGRLAALGLVLLQPRRDLAPDSRARAFLGFARLRLRTGPASRDAALSARLLEAIRTAG